ncbi:contractile injection system protein, VgrG/Pvc8 family [Musicola paradisiaca]|uniref:Late control D family protein n=1 Tax=Musicola paradisiaca (strain Ech703) TaxID=579405 RepID=C6C6Z8_MUSP7|nr:contractile injection system protein, VgrG/Pvc8 family [Musicola paradisiaca]ACS85892.1 late control D family protein [Musicola paradisiaca Ech703]
MIINNRIGIATSLAPDFHITIDKSQTSDESNNTSQAKHTDFKLNDRLIDLSITDNSGTQADSLKITLNDSDGKLLLPERGHKIIVSLGWKGQPLTLMGSYIVDKVTYSGTPDKIDVNAHSVNFRGSLTTPIETSYNDTTLGDIARAIAERNDLLYSIEEAISKKNIDSEHQSKESDITFITRLAKKNDAIATIKNDTLHLFTEGKGINSDGSNMPTYLIERSDGDSFSFTIADRPLNSTVLANWHNNQDAKTHNVKVSRVDKSSTSTQSTHPQAKSTTDATTGTQSSDYTAGAKDNQQALQKTYATQQEAIQAAISKWREVQRQGVTLKLSLAKGQEHLKPGGLVNVKGFKKVIDEKRWSIKTITHSVNTSGFKTSIDLEAALLDVEYEISYDVVVNSSST